MKEACGVGWTPVQYLWKSRVPLIVVPVLLALRNDEPPAREFSSWEILVPYSLAIGTGYLHLPFSITWWLVLLAAFAVQTRFLLAIATVLSLSVLLTWYGLRLRHAEAITALWAGSPISSRCRIFWQIWDLCVHLWPALTMLYSHGPVLGVFEAPSQGVVTSLATLAALPMSLLWLAGLRLGLPTGSGCDLSLSRHAYRVSPELPQKAWTFVHFSHCVVCLLWLAALLLPATVLGATALFAFMGRVKQPFTTAWWCMFMTCLWFSYGPSRSRLRDAPMNLELLKGMTCVCAVTMSTGFYGAQVLAPQAFPSMVLNWAVRPLARDLPSLGQPLLRWSKRRSFWIAARMGDSLLHLIPSVVAVYLFHHHLNAAAALCSLPMNLVWLASAGATSLEATNELYGIQPPLKAYVLHYVYGSHWAICLGSAFRSLS